MYQKLLFAGNLGQDPEMRYTPNGNAVTSFSVASNRRYTNSAGEQVDEVVWFRVSVWGRLAETCNEYLSKGRKVLVEGRLLPDLATGGPRIWTDQNGAARSSFEVSASSVLFLSSRASDNGEIHNEYSEGSLEDEEIPF